MDYILYPDRRTASVKIAGVKLYEAANMMSVECSVLTHQTENLLLTHNILFAAYSAGY
jgi:hypothetical protein